MTAHVDAFVTHAHTTRWQAMPEAARRAVKTFLLDSLGVGIAGARAPLTAKVRTAAELWGAGGGPAHSWGDGGSSMPAASAAFVNGFQIHCQEFDCVHEAAVVHPMATILAALMADAEALGGVSGRAFGEALAVSVDLAASLGVATTSPIKFFRPANAGIFGATLGLSRLRGFTAETTKSALGYALAFCSGTMQAHVEGKPALPVQIANAARGAVMACDIAEAGLDGPHDVLDGPFGYFALFEDAADIAACVATLGQTWRIAEVSHKPFPTGRAAQGGITLMQELRAHGVRADKVQQITLTAPPIIARLVGRPYVAGMSANYARLCFQYCGARALVSGHVRLDDFSDSALADADIAALAPKITVVDDGSADPAAFVPQRALVRLVDGREVSAETNALFGSTAAPLSPAQNIAKFRDCVRFGFGAPRPALEDALIDAVETLETLPDVAVLSRLAAGLES